MDHGVVEVFAYQETLLIMAVFGIALLAMIWVGFRRWLQHKERLGRLIADQTAEHAAQYGAQMQHVEARLDSIEKIVSDGPAQVAGQIGAHPLNATPEPISTCRSTSWRKKKSPSLFNSCAPSATSSKSPKQI